jgi:hypothetical protein
MPKTYEVSLSHKVCGWFEVKDRMEGAGEVALTTLRLAGFSTRLVALEDLPHRQGGESLEEANRRAAIAHADLEELKLAKFKNDADGSDDEDIAALIRDGWKFETLIQPTAAAIFGVERGPNDALTYKPGDRIEMTAFVSPDAKVTLTAVVAGFELKIPSGKPTPTEKDFYSVSKVA